ncbi:glycosyltransferase family 4 protein [Miltoncostaea marina]|uniref:glycosyltransferase family 4 protein n=1 Tax=Miltoncostaea marina TaxID=2843215 RepID=UPI001C3C7465|nr:MraY family glycosyltransferase [Miltoncostaea marina]
MTTDLIPILSAIAAALVVLGATPLAMRLARATGAVDVPSGRRIHSEPTPRLGGLAILLGFLVPVVAFLPDDPSARALITGAVLITALGAADDIWGLTPGVKLAGQVACAAIPVAAGLTIDHITLPLLGVGDLGWAQYPITVLWFVALVNMINFTDGMDGLAAGISGLGATTFAILAASLGRADPAIMAAALAGACAAFLVFNFHPARVFMGDAGSMLLGFVIAGVAIGGVMKSAAAIAVVAPLVILAIPILDTSFVILKRLKHGLPVYNADRSHFHHRFFTIGWSQRKTVLALYGWCALMGAVAIALRFVRYRDADGHLQLAGTAVLSAAGLLALAASIYLVYVLEILKWRSTPVVTLVRQSRLERASRREMAGRS